MAWNGVTGLLQVSLPKAGTFYLKDMLYDLVSRTQSKFMQIGETDQMVPDYLDYYVWGHLPCNERAVELTKDMQRIFLYRDFRDILVSWEEHATRKGFMHCYGKCEDTAEIYKQTKDKLGWLICYLPEYFEQQLKWLTVPGIIPIRYEWLRTGYLDPLEPLGLDMDEIRKRNLTRGSKTFRQGHIGRWVEVFQPHHVKAYWEYWGYIEKSIP